MMEQIAVDATQPWAARWRVGRTTLMTALSWILTLPALAHLLHWRRRTATWVQNIFGPVTGLVWGRIGWIGVRRYGFSNEDAFLAGGLVGAIAPTVELTLRRLGWPPGTPGEPDLRGERPNLAAYPFAWFGGFVFGGLLAAIGAEVARRARE